MYNTLPLCIRAFRESIEPLIHPFAGIKELLIAVIAAAWAETAEPEKLKELHPDELFYTVSDFAGWLMGKL